TRTTSSSCERSVSPNTRSAARTTGTCAASSSPRRTGVTSRTTPAYRARSATRSSTMRRTWTRRSSRTSARTSGSADAARSFDRRLVDRDLPSRRAAARLLLHPDLENAVLHLGARFDLPLGGRNEDDAPEPSLRPLARVQPEGVHRRRPARAGYRQDLPVGHHLDLVARD